MQRSSRQHNHNIPAAQNPDISRGPLAQGAATDTAPCRRWHEHHDIDAARHLVGRHLPLVVGMAMQHNGYGITPQELVREAYVGLMRTLCRYGRGSVVAFASHAIGEMHAAVRRRIGRAWLLRAGRHNGRTKDDVTR